ncbi:MAG: MarR family transcriptional regulator [Desulfobacterium sp.]|nr:MarR family transcriptional regulator [Desulfobacterium sp.]
MNRDHILFIIGRINYKVNRFLIRELKKHHIKGIAPSHGEILGALLIRERLQMKELAEIIDKDKSTITALVNKLMVLGYVEKAKDDDDSRISIISLTQKGKALKPSFLEVSKTMCARAYDGISESDKEKLYVLLMKLNKSL